LEDSATFFNGRTTLDATTYIARAHPSHLDELLSIEGVRLGSRCASITDSAFAREREVVVNELRLGGDSGDVRAAAYAGLFPPGHPYGRPADSEHSVREITRDQACAFADAHYGPANAVLVVSGDVTAADVKAALGKFIGRIPRRVTAPSASVPAVANTARYVEHAIPIDEDFVLIPWPLPSDPGDRAKMRAIAPIAFDAIDRHVKGVVVPSEFGDTRAPMIGVIAAPGSGESIAELTKGAQIGLGRVASGYGDALGLDAIK